jgi:hypothetical protein
MASQTGVERRRGATMAPDFAASHVFDIPQMLPVLRAVANSSRRAVRYGKLQI